MIFTFGLIIGLLIGYCIGAYSFYRYAVKRGWMERRTMSDEDENSGLVGKSLTQKSDLIPCPKVCDVKHLDVYRLPDSPSRHIYCRKCNWAGPWGNTYDEAKQEWNTRQ